MEFVLAKTDKVRSRFLDPQRPSPLAVDEQHPIPLPPPVVCYIVTCYNKVVPHIASVRPTTYGDDLWGGVEPFHAKKERKRQAPC